MNTAEIHLYSDIGEAFGGTTVPEVAATLKSLPRHDRLLVRINSPGGSVFDGMAIYNLLRGHSRPLSVQIDGIAASIAAVIAQVAPPGQLRMATGSMMMIHAPWSLTIGDALAHDHTATTLRKVETTIVDILARRSGQTADRVNDWLKEETWFTAAEAADARLADNVVPAPAMAASLTPRPWIHALPEPLRRQAHAAKHARDRLDQRI